MQNNSVDKSIFHFLGARIWAPMPVYQYENCSGYVIGHMRNLWWWWWWWWIVFVVWLTDERRLALFPAGTIVRDPYHRKSEFRLSWMKLCSSDNHYTTAPQFHVIIMSFLTSSFLLQFEYCKNQKCSLDETKSIFHNFLRASFWWNVKN